MMCYATKIFNTLRRETFHNFHVVTAKVIVAVGHMTTRTYVIRYPGDS